MNNEQNIVQTALDAGKQLAPKVHTNPIPDSPPFVILEDGQGAQRIEHLPQPSEAIKPLRIARKLAITTPDSFIHYFKKHRNQASSIYAYDKTLTAIIDDHDRDAPNHAAHRADYTLAYSSEWQIWTSKNHQPFKSPEEFAAFIEDRLADFVDPPGATMLEIALNFHVTQNASYSKAVRLQDGTSKLIYSIEGEARAGEHSIPGTFSISIPVHDGTSQPHYNISARLRWRLAGNALSLWFDLIAPHKAQQLAAETIINRVQAEAGTTIIMGRP